jgi:hypothetical protein
MTIVFDFEAADPLGRAGDTRLPAAVHRGDQPSSPMLATSGCVPLLITAVTILAGERTDGVH